jgi:thiosulfate dehydrogenase [quinone] large subunit
MRPAEMATHRSAETRTGADRALAPRLWAVGRILVAWVFLWTFIDKLVGAGLNTDRGWLAGGSPTAGFLRDGATGPFGTFYRDVTGGGGWVDWIYMGSMLAIGLGLLLGLMTRLAALGGIAWMVLFYTASFGPENNPIVDQHVAYAALLVGVIVAGAGRTWGLGRWWDARFRTGRAPYWLGG